MQKTTGMSCFALVFAFVYLFSLPGMFSSQAHAQDTPQFNPQDSFEYCSPDATSVDVQFQTFENASMQAIIDDAVPVSDEFLSDPDNSFFKGFVDAIKERYPFGDDTSKAMINIAEDALIVVIGIGITIVVTGVTAALAAAGAASAGTVLVAVLIAGAAIGLVFAIGTIINEYLKGNKADAGAKTFNLVRELILLLAGGAIATKAFASKTASQAIKLAKYLENKLPEAMAWLRETVNPICHGIVLWVKDLPFKIGLLARGKKPTTLEVFIKKGNYSEVEISHLYKDPNGNTALWKTSDDPEFVLLSFNGAPPIKPTYNQATLSLKVGKFDLIESNMRMRNPDGQIVLWKKYHTDPNKDYIRIKGGDYNSQNVSADDALAMYTEAASAEIRLNTDGTITKKFNELEGGILLADPAHEARMMKLWEEINPSSSPVLIEEGQNFLRMSQLNGKPLDSFKPGELKLNPGAWERFVARVLNYHNEGYVFNDFGYQGRNLYVVDGELHILDFGLSTNTSPKEIQMELEILGETYQFLKDLGVKDIKPVGAIASSEGEFFADAMNGYYHDRGFLIFRTSSIPEQGWKIHISSKPEKAKELADIILPILRDAKINHKIVVDMPTYKTMNGTQKGKLITIYPENDAQAVEIVQILDEVLIGRFSDFYWKPLWNEIPVGKSGLVWSRYGAFKSDYIEHPGTKGLFIPDNRAKPFPDGVENPFKATNP